MLDAIESRNLKFTRPAYIGKRSHDKWEKILKKGLNKQLHIYGNTRFWPYRAYDLNSLFDELFVPNPEICKTIARYRAEFEKWDGLTFRFQNLLNDFSEPIKSIDLDEQEIAKLIGKCLNYVEQYSKQTDNCILVTTDSKTFLQAVKRMEKSKIIVIDGPISHVNFDKNIKQSSVLKSFLDFFMLAESESISSVGTNFMYRGGFPQLAAWIKNKPFSRVTI